MTAAKQGARYKKGDRVAIVNTLFSGKFVLEGMATVVRATNMDHRYVVNFGGRDNCERWIDDDAQSDPAAYIKSLNDRRAAVFYGAE